MDSTEHKEEVTFRNYDAQQAKSYASYRPDYPPALCQYILDHHTSTGGGRGLVLDLGTGHGNVVRAFAPHFERAVGADPSLGMLDLAKALAEEKGVRTKDGGRVAFVAGSAEAMEEIEGVSKEGVDLIVAATAVSRPESLIGFKMSRLKAAEADAIG